MCIRDSLSTQWKCGVCEHYTCSECLEYIGPTKPRNVVDTPVETVVSDGTTEETATTTSATATANAFNPHVCKTENVESAKLIKKDSRKCPSCATPIFRVQGCNQMFCTYCNTNFDWASGKKINGVIHNPHYFEYMRTRTQEQINRDDENNRNNDDNININQASIRMEDRCNNTNLVENTQSQQMNLNIVYRWKRLNDLNESNMRKFNLPPNYIKRSHNLLNVSYEFLQELIRSVMHNMDNHVRGHNLNDAQEKERELRLLRVSYLSGDITEELFKHKVQIIDKKYSKINETLEVIAMANNVMNDLNFRFVDRLLKLVDFAKKIFGGGYYGMPKYGISYLLCLLSDFSEYIHLNNFVRKCLKEVANTYNNRVNGFHVFEVFSHSNYTFERYLNELYFVITYFFETNGVDVYSNLYSYHDRSTHIIHSYEKEKMPAIPSEWTAFYTMIEEEYNQFHALASAKASATATASATANSQILSIVDFQVLPYQEMKTNVQLLFTTLGKIGRHDMFIRTLSTNESYQIKKRMIERYI